MLLAASAIFCKQVDDGAVAVAVVLLPFPDVDGSIFFFFLLKKWENIFPNLPLCSVSFAGSGGGK